MTDATVEAGEELPPRLINTEKLAELLDVPPRHVRRLVQERRIPYVKWGHLIRFDPAELRHWIDAYRRRPDRSA